jgi:ABC-2 type transport system permease protein/sodium transport system permease protein
MLAAISPGLVALMPGMRLGGLITVTPLLNVVLLAKEILEGGVPLGQGTIVVLTTLFYAFSAIAIAARLFGAEAVLYSEQANWSDLFRRPREARDTASRGAALLCLAVMFPVSFLLNGAIGSARTLVVEEQMVLLAAVFVVLFVGFPLISAYLSRVRVATGFQLAAPSLIAVIGAVCLGLSLWTFIGELAALQEKIGFSTIPEQLRYAVHAAKEQWRTAPFPVLIAMALIPGIVEEFFFRGYLYSALAAASRPWSAIIVSALLFGAFHLFLGGSPALERFLPSTLMGLVLALVRWRSGSIWPGVVLHVLHNGLLLSVDLFPATFGSVADAIESTGHIPPIWLLGGAGVAAIGGFAVWFSGRLGSL